MEITRITGNNAEYYEDLMPAGVLANEELLKIGAISDEGEACGVIAVGITGPMAYIEWLYTEPSMRGRGMASVLLEVVTKLLSGMDLEGIEADFNEDDEELEDFLSGRGFLIGDDNGIYSIPLEDIIYSEEMDQIAETVFGEKGVMQVNDKAIRKGLVEFIREKDISNAYLEDVSKRYSFVRVNDKDQITGCILIREGADDDLDVIYLKTNSAADTLASLLRAVHDAIIENGHASGCLNLTDRKGRAISLIEGLTGEDRDIYRVEGHRHAIMLWKY